MSKHFELVVFTASLSKYAEPLMKQLDPEELCYYKLFREHCTFYNNAFVKDLTRLGRNMKDVIIVDNSPVAYLF
jgi:RNA polymerase II subunit A small phosphatase-like protein